MTCKIFCVLIFFGLGYQLFAQTEYEAVVFDRSVLMGDNVRNVRRDVPYLSPLAYQSWETNIIDGMQRLSYFQEEQLSRISSVQTRVTTDFFRNKLYSVEIFISKVNRQRIQDDITALRNIYGKESSNHESKETGLREGLKWGQVIWHFRTSSNGMLNFAVVLNYNEMGGASAGTFQYTLEYTYFPVLNELNAEKERSKIPLINELIIPRGITSIQNGALLGDSPPKNIIGHGVGYIDDVFYIGYSWVRINSVIIPDSVKTIGTMAFGLIELNSVTIPNSVTTIGALSFERNKLTKVIIPNSVTSIGAVAFNGNSLTDVTLPSGITTIEGKTFAGNKLKSIIIPNSVVKIESSAFINNPITSVTIGANVELGDGFGDVFENRLDNFYITNGKKAGTYTFLNGRWSLR